MQERFETLVAQAIAQIPSPFREALDAVVVSVAEMPPPEMLQDMGLHDPMSLTGLYDGVPLTEKSILDQPVAPDVIWLFRAPILAEWHDRGDVELGDLIQHVLVHELAHHFGWTDAQIAQIDRWWE